MYGLLLGLLIISIGTNTDIQCHTGLITNSTCVSSVPYTCISCGADVACGYPADHIYDVSNAEVCDAACRDDVSCLMAVYKMTSYTCSLFHCSLISEHSGQIAYLPASSCDEDCHTFSLEMFSDTGSECSEIDIDTDIEDVAYCISGCIERTNCRVLTYVSTNMTCHYHYCNGSDVMMAEEAGSITITRTCIDVACDRDYDQQCLNCEPGPLCPYPYSFINGTYHSRLCSDGDQTAWIAERSLATLYDEGEGRCYYFYCGQVQPADQSTLMYRKSCRDDCPTFSLEMIPDVCGVCIPMAELSHLSGVNDCLEKCLDTPFCASVSYGTNSTGAHTCLLFDQDCHSFESDANYTSVNVTCQIQGEIFNFTQVCHGCGIGPSCPPPFAMSRQYAEYHCNSSWEDFKYAVSIMFNASDSACLAFNCMEATQQLGNTIYRVTNNHDCLELELFVYKNHTGANCGIMTVLHDILRYDDCIGPCLDTPGCRGVTYAGATETCTLQSCADHHPSTERVFIKKACQPYWPHQCQRNWTQTCENCKADRRCPMGEYYAKVDHRSAIGMTLLTDYPDAFMISLLAYLDVLENPRCLQVERQSESLVYRASCASDCPWYEIFPIHDASGTCPVLMSLDGSVSAGYCLQRCLDLTDCRGVTFNNDNESCKLHDCDTWHEDDGRYLFIQRHCLSPEQECFRNITQTCYNCKSSHLCLQSYAYEADVKFADNCSIDNTQADGIAFFDREYSACYSINCSHVSVDPNDVTSRTTCRQDCQRHRVFQLKLRKGTCAVIGSTSGTDDFSYCLSKCLDMQGCMGVTVNMPDRSCSYHSCNAHKESVDKNDYFYKIDCVTSEPNCRQLFVQTCRNCIIGDNCQQHFHGTTATDRASCLELRPTDFLPQSRVYCTKTGSCRSFNCSSVNQDMFTEMYRPSCSSWCQHYRIYELTGYQGTCDTLEVDVDGVSYDYCVEKCLSMDFCLAVTYHNGGCSYHSCTQREGADSVGYKFFTRTCEGVTEQKPYIQSCVNCWTDCSEETYVDETEGVVSASTCSPPLNPATSVLYSARMETCIRATCDYPLRGGQGTTLVRMTAAQDCPRFHLATVYNAAPTCDVMWYTEGFYNVDYCIRLCMDTLGCRSVILPTFDDRNCTMYACANYTSGSNEMVLRQCEMTCTDPVLQHCMNCGPGPECQQPFSSVMELCEEACLSSNTCEGFVTLGASCQLFQCNEVMQSSHTTFKRKTCERNCQKYMMYTLTDHMGMCDVILTEELVEYPYLCFDRCLDMPGCRAITHEAAFSRCHYHTCDCAVPTEQTGNTTFLWRYCMEANSTLSPLHVMATQFCLPTTHSTTTTTPTTTTRTTTTVTTSARITYPSKPSPPPIYLISCACSSGAFANMTSEELAWQFEKNLTLNRRKLSAHVREHTSASDDREYSAVIGSSGAIFVGVVGLIIFIVDARRIIAHLLYLP